MKSLPTALAAHIATRDTTLATALKITRTDGTVFGFTSHDVDDVIAGVTYKANPGLLVTDIVIAANAAVGNLSLTTLHDGTVFTTADVIGGVWRNAKFEIFRYNWSSLGDGIDTLLVGTVGEFQLLKNTVIAELRDLRQYLQQDVGNASSKTCRARLGDARCRAPIMAFEYNGTISGVLQPAVFQDWSLTQAICWFDEGEVRFTGGANAGLSFKVKTFVSSSTFALVQTPPRPLVIGDTFIATAGCRKRLEEDCRDKFNNVVNFVGEPHRMGVNNLTKPAGAP